MKYSSSVRSDFEKRANRYELDSMWVTSDTINNVPFLFFSQQDTLGDVIDVGGGTAYLSNYLCRQLRHNSITVIDLSSSMLDIARLRMPDAIIINESIERFYENNETKYDTILARQIFHYVDDVDNIVGILHKMLNKNGILYVGQFVVSDNDSNLWHESFIKKISVNRKRSFIDKEFISLFTNEGFEVVKTEYTPYEENIKSFYNRSTNLGINYGELYDYSVSSLKESVKNDLLIRITDDNLFFTVKFLHLFLTIK